MAILRINFSRVIAQANEINSISDDISKQIQAIEEMESEIRASWQGRAAQTFLAQTEALRNAMRGTSKKTADLSNAIKNVACRIQREDEESAERARQLE